MILVVDLNYKPDSLAYTEFVSPILAEVEPIEPCKVKHFTQLTQQDIEGCSRIILSGTTLKDFEVQQHLDMFRWLKTCSKPLLGICAGMQVIGLVLGASLVECSQVGMTEIQTQKTNPLFLGTFQAYTLHSLSLKADSDFEVLATSQNCIQAVKHPLKPIFGVLFHPEVRNPEVLRNFCRLT